MHRIENKLVVKIQNLNCDDCTSKIEKFLSRIKGVKDATVNARTSELTVDYDPALAEESNIRQSLSNLGYSVDNSAKPIVSTFAVEGIDCPDEAFLLEKGLKQLNGVEEVTIDIVGKTVTVKHHRSCCFDDVAARKAGECGLKLTPYKKGGDFAEAATDKKKLLATIIAGSLCAAGFVLEVLGAVPSIYIPLYLASMASAGSLIAKKAFYAAVNLRLDINVLMTIGAVGAALLGEWIEGASVYFLFSVANLIESYTFERSRKAIRSLMQLVPEEAWLVKDGSALKTPAGSVKVGEVILVKPGEKIPLDGRVTKGASSVDQSPIIGESMPAFKTVGDDVYSGAINKEGALEVEVTHRSADSTISRIIDLVEKARSQKAPSQLFVDKFARYYTPAVIFMAMAVAALPPLLFGLPFSVWAYRALVILVISCPCALVISTPVAIVTALTKAAKDGVLIKGGVHVENLAGIKAVAFDKTGTLTTGRAMLTDILPLNHFPAGELLRLAASVEASSEHHLAKAIVEKAAKENLKLTRCDEFKSVPGKGATAQIHGSTYHVGSLRFLSEIGVDLNGAQAKLSLLEEQGKTLVLVAEEKTIVGALAMADEVRREAPEAIKSLKAQHILHTALLTGDNEVTARAVARKAGVDEYISKLLPEDKVKTIARLRDCYAGVAMVGDGVNDAPALAAATVGIAMGAAGTDVALETADVALMADDLTKLPHAVRLSKKTLQLIKENIALSLLVKAAFLFMAFPGWSTLWMAVGADMVVSLAVIANSMRILRIKPSGSTYGE